MDNQINPWGYQDGTILRHKRYCWEVQYCYDRNFGWCLWNGRGLMDLGDWKKEEFMIPIDTQIY